MTKLCNIYLKGNKAEYENSMVKIPVIQHFPNSIYTHI